METTVNALDALRALLEATPANPVPVDRATLAVAVDELAALRTSQGSRHWMGDLDDLQQFVDVVEDGTVTPDDVAVAREAIRALHDALAGRAG